MTIKLLHAIIEQLCVYRAVRSEASDVWQRSKLGVERPENVEVGGLRKHCLQCWILKTTIALLEDTREIKTLYAPILDSSLHPQRTPVAQYCTSPSDSVQSEDQVSH